MKVVRATFRGENTHKRLELVATTTQRVQLGEKYERKTDCFKVVFKVTDVISNEFGVCTCILQEVTSFGRPTFWKQPAPLGEIIGTNLTYYTK